MKYPDWVDKYREKGTSIKKVGDSYYLYKTTSKRIAGYKNPQPQSEFVGVITPQGVEKSGKQKIDAKQAHVYEYGFSYALKALLPEKIKKDIGAEQAEILLFSIISEYSPISYLLRDNADKAKEEKHFCMSAQRMKFERLTGIQISELLELRYIFQVEIGGRKIISEISEKQKTILEKVGIKI